MSRVVRDNAQCLRLKIRRTRARSVPWKIVKWFLAGSVEYRRKFLIRFLQLPDVVSINGSLNGFLFISHRLILISAYRLTCGNPLSSILSILLIVRGAFEKHARILHRSCTFLDLTSTDRYSYVTHAYLKL